LEGDKKTEEYKISFGGYINELYNGQLVGEWQINFHNVGNDTFDKSKFHTTNIDVVNFYNGNGTSCNDAMNFDAYGTWNGMPGYKITFRAGDFGSPGKADTIRIHLFDPDGDQIYDTHAVDFSDWGGYCVGASRTYLDSGNITIAP